MKRNLKYIIPLVVICIIIFSVMNKSKSPDTFTQVFAFGDSCSDNGQAKKISGDIMNDENTPEGAYLKPSDELYWNGRYSNGNTAVEVLSQNLKIELTNYATGGATTGPTNYSDWMDYLGNTGVLGQIEQFKTSLNGKQADPDALYFIFASANDYFKHMDYNLPGDINDVADKAVSNLQTAVTELNKLGAKKFLVVNSLNLSLVPYEITVERTDIAKQYTERLNSNLEPAMMKLKDELNVSITMFDMTKLSDEIVSNSDKYGFKFIDTPCQNTYPEVKPVNENPDEYCFWDEWHFTKAMHKILGNAMFDQIQAAK